MKSYRTPGCMSCKLGDKSKIHSSRSCIGYSTFTDKELHEHEKKVFANWKVDKNRKGVRVTA